jgi:phosphatidylglycerophosphatase A
MVIAIGDTSSTPHADPPPREAGEAPLSAWLIASWFGSGLLPRAPGSWGSLAALPFAWGIATAGGAVALVAAAAVLFFLGWWAAERVTRASGIADDGTVVVDEVVGQWLTLAAAPLDLGDYLLGFLLFRVFDIVKPWPVRWADRRVPGGLGVMADDVLAAVYAAAVLVVLRIIGRHVLG